MDYMNLIQKTLDYIDDHIMEKITVDQLAELAGFSTYHYYRVFNSFVGMPVMDSNNGKVSDITFDYGFETHAGFTKAFKKCFGYAPTFYRLHASIGLPQKVNLRKLKENKIGGIIMQPKIIQRDAFKITTHSK